MDVRLRGCDDAEPFFPRDVDIAVDIAFGVDHDRLSGALAPDEVGVLGEIRIEYLAKEHFSNSVSCGVVGVVWRRRSRLRRVH